MGNCKSKSNNHVIGPSHLDDNKGAFRYDKDSKKILFIGEDAEDTEITGLGSSQSYVSTSTKSADPSALNVEPVERSLLGEIAEFLENDGDDSTVNTMSTRGRASPTLYIPKPQSVTYQQDESAKISARSNQYDLQDKKEKSSASPRTFDLHPMKEKNKLTNDPYFIQTQFSDDGSDKSSGTTETSTLNGLNHLLSCDSQVQRGVTSQQDPDPDDWDDDFISASTFTDKEESSNSVKRSNDFDDMLKMIIHDEASTSSKEGAVDSSLKRITMSKSDDSDSLYDEGYIPIAKTSSYGSSQKSNSTNDAELSDDNSFSSACKCEVEVQNSSIEGKDSDKNGMTELSSNSNVKDKATQEDELFVGNDCKKDYQPDVDVVHHLDDVPLNTNLEENDTEKDDLMSFSDHQQQPKPRRSNTKLEEDNTKKDGRTSVSDHQQQPKPEGNVVETAIIANAHRVEMHAAIESDETGTCDLRSTNDKDCEEKEDLLSNRYDKSLTLPEKSFILESDHYSSKKEISLLDLSEKQLQSFGAEVKEISSQNKISDKEVDFLSTRSKIDCHRDMLNEIPKHCNNQVHNSAQNELKYNAKDLSYSDFSNNQDVSSENENGLSFDEDEDTDLSRDDSVNKNELDEGFVFTDENNSYLANVPDDEKEEITKYRGSPHNDLSRVIECSSEECKISNNNCTSDNTSVMDDLSCLLDENLGNSEDTDNRSPLMSPETILIDQQDEKVSKQIPSDHHGVILSQSTRTGEYNTQEDNNLGHESPVKEKRFSQIPRVPQYSPIKCRSPYTGNRKSLIQPPSPARAHLHSNPELLMEETSGPSFERKTPCNRSSKLSEVTPSAFSVSSHGDQSVTPQSLPWDEKEGSKYTRSQKKKVLPGSATSVGTPKSSTKRSNYCSSQWDPYLHMEKNGCERCLTLCSDVERDMFFEFGRHQRVTRTSGGCTKNCTRYAGERFYDCDAVVLCRICFHAVHRRSQANVKDPTVRSLATEYCQDVS